MRVLAVLALVLAVLQATLSAAEAQSVTFGGERYSQKYRQFVNASHSYVELGRDGESLKGWTKLITLHVFPQTADPKAAVGALARTVRQRDKSARMSLIANDATGESMLDFLAFQGDLAEFNVFKYAPAGNGRGVVAVQFARRFRLGELDADEVRRLRQRAVDEMAGFDVGPARAAFAR
jgi:hypothetical protein